MAQALHLLDWAMRERGHVFEIVEYPISRASIMHDDVAHADDILSKALESEIILVNPMNEPACRQASSRHGLCYPLSVLCQQHDLFISVRAIRSFASVSNALFKRQQAPDFSLILLSTLAHDSQSEPSKGIMDLDEGEKQAVDIWLSESHQIQRVAKLALELALSRRGHVTVLDRADAVNNSRLWHQEIQSVCGMSAITIESILAKDLIRQFIYKPEHFDVIATDAFLADLISNLASAILGIPVGMFPSAFLGPIGSQGQQCAIYSSLCDGISDIAGYDLANPLGMMLAIAMMLRFSCEDPHSADQIERAINDVLAHGSRTADIMSPGMAQVSTATMGEMVLYALR